MQSFTRQKHCRFLATRLAMCLHFGIASADAVAATCLAICASVVQVVRLSGDPGTDGVFST